jgi:hypothetical protein
MIQTIDYDFNPQNYSLHELETILQLPENYNYDILQKNVLQIKEKLLENDALDNEAVARTLSFLQNAASQIVKSMKKNEKLKEEELKETKDFHKKFLHVVSDAYLPNYHLDPVKIVQNDANHFIQDKKRTVYTQSYPGEYFPGVINPLKKRITRQNLNIDTRFRENYYNSQSSNYYVDLPIKFHSIVTIQLTAIELPISFYVISKQLGNNFFTILLPESNQSETISIPDGNYNYHDLMTCINTFLGNLGGNFQYINFSTNISTLSSGSGNVIVGINTTSDLFALLIIIYNIVIIG